MDLGIKDKVALVAASSQGLGKAAAMSLAKEGVNLAICSRNEKSIHATAEEIAHVTGVEVLPIPADVSNAKDIERVLQATIQEYGTIHILVNNAGGPPAGKINSIQDEEY